MMSNIPHFVIVGNGPAGNTAAAKIREQSPEARITIISDEPFHFYSRCKLPEYAAGVMDEENLFLRDSVYYEERDIKLRLGQKVIEIDAEKRTLLLDHRERISFDKLIMATGGRPKMPEKLAESAPCIRTMKNLVDARRWKKSLEEAERILLVGGDLVSIRFARVLASVGKDVTLSLWDEAFWPLELKASLIDQIVQSLTSKGIKVRSTLPFSSCEPSGERVLCRFGDGEEALFDIVGGFFGYEPEVALLRQTGLQLDHGIIVDEHLRTNMRNIYAAGDAAQVYNPDLLNYWVSIGWNNAEGLGALAACNALGHGGEAREGAESYLDIEGVKVNTSWWTEV